MALLAPGWFESVVLMRDRPIFSARIRMSMSPREKQMDWWCAFGPSGASWLGRFVRSRNQSGSQDGGGDVATDAAAVGGAAFELLAAA